MIQGLLGFKEVAKNSQNQIILPAEFRDIFEDKRSGGKYYVYMQEGRSLLLSTLNELIRDLGAAAQGDLFSAFDQDAFTVLSKHVAIVNIGGDGRLTLSRTMMKMAGIDKDDKQVVCCGANNKVEIWSAARFNEQIEQREQEYASLRRAVEKEIFKFRIGPAEDRSEGDEDQSEGS